MHPRAAATILLLPGLFGCAAATAGGGAPSPVDLRLEEVADPETLVAALRGDEFIRASPDTGLVLISYDSIGARERVTYSHQLATAAQSAAVEDLFRSGIAQTGPVHARAWFLVLGGDLPRVERFESSSETRPEVRNRRHLSLLLEDLARRPGFRPRRVILDLHVGVHGEIRDVTVVESSGSAAVDAAMLDVARQAQFTPARLDRFPVAVTVRMPFSIVERRRPRG